MLKPTFTIVAKGEFWRVHYFQNSPSKIHPPQYQPMLKSTFTNVAKGKFWRVNFNQLLPNFHPLKYTLQIPPSTGIRIVGRGPWIIGKSHLFEFIHVLYYFRH